MPWNPVITPEQTRLEDPTSAALLGRLTMEYLTKLQKMHASI